MLRFAVFTDTYNEINGQSGIYKNLVEWNEKTGKISLHIFTVATANNNWAGNYSHVHFIRNNFLFRFPLYKEQLLGFPKINYIDKVFHNNKFDAVLLSAPGPICFAGLLIAKRFSLPCFGFYHTRFVEFAKIYGNHIGGVYLAYLFGKFAKFIHNLLYRKCCAIFTQSLEMSVDIREFTTAPIIEIKTGVNRNIFFPNMQLKSPPKRVVYIGRVAWEKNLDVFIPIRNELEKLGLELLLVGGGPYASELKKNFGIRSTGFVSQTTVSEILRNSGILIFPSLVDTFGNVIMESLACGIPIIIAKGTATANFLRNTNASLEFDPNNSKDLLEKIRLIWNDENNWLKLRLNAIKYGANSWDVTFDDITEFIIKKVYTQHPAASVSG